MTMARTVVAFLSLVLTVIVLFSSFTSASGSDNGVPVVFDYVIDGGGAGALTVAYELTNDPLIRVLMIEKGIKCPDCDASLTAGFRPNDPYFENAYPLTQEFAAGLRQPSQMQFSSLGGNTKIMGNVYTLASKKFLDTRFPVGFRHDDLLPYYKENEDHFCHYLPSSLTNISAADCTAYHGRGGPIKVAPQAFPTVTAQAIDLVSYLNTTGIGYSPDYNGPKRAGVSYEQNFRGMENPADLFSRRFRHDTQNAFLNDTVAARSNLFILTNTEVRELIVNRRTKRVQGVRYSINGSSDMDVALALRRVWVCNGVIRTPQKLQMAGIGPAEWLNQLGIEVVANNSEIGRNFKAHQALSMNFQTKEPVTKNSSYTGGNLLQLFFNTGLTPDLDADVQVEVLGGTYVEGLEGSANSFPLRTILAGATGVQPYLTALVEVIAPSSEGFVRARPGPIQKVPEFDFGWNYANMLGAGFPNTDLRKMMTAIQTVRDIFIGNNSYANKNILREAWPGDKFFRELAAIGVTDDATAAAYFGIFGLTTLREAADFWFIQYEMTHFYHLTSSVALGKATNMLGAVNGVTGLNVCDNSILPANPDGNPTATLMAVCRKLAREQLAADRLGF